MTQQIPRLALPSVGLILLVAGGLTYTPGTLPPLLMGIAGSWTLVVGLLFWSPWAGTLGSGLLGSAVSLYLGRQHVLAASSSICTVDATFNCDAVNQSQYSEIFGIPIAFLGLGFYAGVAVVSMMALARQQDPRTGHALFGLGLLGSAYSVFLAAASATLGAWCLFCISMYGFTALIALGGFLAIRDSELACWPTVMGTLLFKDKSLTMSTLAGVFVVVTVLASATMRSTPAADITDPTPADLTMLYEVMDAPVALRGDEPSLGSPNAPLTIVEFADFECPYCGTIAPEMKSLVSDNPGTRLLFKHYPISSLCNENIGRPGHEQACGAAAAAECARQQGRFWELSRLIFLNQEHLEPSSITFMAKQIELDLEAFNTCLTDEKTLATVRDDISSATAAQVDGTPSLYLLGGDGDRWWKIKGGPEALAQLLKSAQGS